ncbi:MAG: ABC transporter permease [Patescibacteria group bacterium]
MKNRASNIFHEVRVAIRVGWFLALRQVRRANIWTNVLVIAIMALTFLNLVVVSGILVGLIEGSVKTIKTHYLGDVFISTPKGKNFIQHSQDIVKTAENIPGVVAVSARYLEGGIVEEDYKKTKKPGDSGNEVGTNITGIDPDSENRASDLARLVVEGEYLSPDDYDQVLVGSLLLKKYLDFESPNFPVLERADIGTKIRITLGGNTREVTVKGIIKSKADELDRRIFMVDRQFRNITNRFDYNADEIVIRIAPGVDSKAVRDAILATGAGAYARVQTAEEGEPKFVKDMKKTFNMLGTVISSIGLVVAAITIFIVIFINAITRRKFIGILKGIGINALAIEIAYVLQSVFYAILGTALGVAFVFGFLKPYLDVHPINFPFSDGILVATLDGTLLRVAALFIATLIAGYIPARIVTKQNTLDAILNR